MNLLNYNVKDFKKELADLEGFTTLPIFSIEILNQSYPDIFPCSYLFCEKNS